MHTAARPQISIFGAGSSPASATLAAEIKLFFLISLCLALIAQPLRGQTYKVLYAFTGGPTGASPITGLSMDAAGNLYGTAVWGGVSGCDNQFGCGTVFKLTHTNTGWSYSRLYAFDWSDGAAPNSKLVFGPDGNLYGATVGGGGRGDGAVFGLIPQQTLPSMLGSWKENMLYSLLGGPFGDILIDPQSGQIYGVTIIGGEGFGVVYSAKPGGVIYIFKGSPSDGNGPEGGPIFDRYGNLCGTTATGGQTQFGTVYCVTTSGQETILYNFQHGSDGELPQGGLAADQAGNLYGTTSHGGAGQGGTVFMLSPSGSGWTFNLLYSLTGYGGAGTLTMDAAGNLYGVAGSNGAYSGGNVFKLSRSGGNWTYTSLHDFTFTSDGGAPQGSVLIDGHGNLYGTAKYGGWFGPGCDYGCGVVWEITP